MRSVTFTLEIRAESTDLYPLFDFNVNNKGEDQLLLGGHIPGLSVLGLLGVFISPCPFWFQLLPVQSTFHEAFKDLNTPKSHQFFCNSRQNSSPSPFFPLLSYSCLRKDRRIVKRGENFRKWCGGKTVQAGVGKGGSVYAGKMLRHYRARKGFRLDGAVTRNQQSLE